MSAMPSLVRQSARAPVGASLGSPVVSAMYASRMLHAWSADAPFEPPEPSMQLPVTVEEGAPARGVTIDVAPDGLYVEGWRAGSATFWAEQDAVLVSDLYEALQRVGGDTVVIRAHQEAPWKLVGKVLFTAQQAGYGEIELVAVSRASL